MAGTASPPLPQQHTLRQRLDSAHPHTHDNNSSNNGNSSESRVATPFWAPVFQRTTIRNNNNNNNIGTHESEAHAISYSPKQCHNHTNHPTKSKAGIRARSNREPCDGCSRTPAPRCKEAHDPNNSGLHSSTRPVNTTHHIQHQKQHQK